MKESSACLWLIFAIIAIAALLSGVICLSLSLLWLAFGIAKNIAMAYLGLGLGVGGWSLAKLLNAMNKE